ncbi:MAG TPA: ComEC/Rec2 family competence protein [Solirubrobacterales bacterium]|nr:ComEC/Rec2 family competence protein [Solirubrobacterales bacterium]
MASPSLPVPVVVGIVLLAVLALTHSGEIRQRASEGLGRGAPPREAELARGFVLGEDEDVDVRTKEDFRRSGLSHLLAVSGENVTLLALLAMPLLGAFGVPLRERLLWILGLIAVYVPVAGAGPSVQRAAVMGAAGLLATLRGRRASRLYALVLAALVTLAVAPAAAADVGWQLSFAAVLGILLLAAPLARAIGGWLGSGPWRRALAEGLAVTIAATLATAPLIAFHFEELSTTTLVANVLALPAVAPAMWLGMLSAAASQVPGLPVEVLNGFDALLLAYIAQIASWCAAPEWAELHVHLGGSGLLLSYLTLGGLTLAGLRLPRRVLAIGAPALALATAVLLLPSFTAGGTPPPPAGLRVTVLDIGQGDAILLQPARAPAVLVDGGPPGDGLQRKLDDAAVDRLGAAVITHDQADHAGGVEDLLGAVPVSTLVYGRLDRRVLAAARAAGAVTRKVAAGSEIRSGGLGLQVLWPPPELQGPTAAAVDPNPLGLVIEARWRSFTMLLTADAEAATVPLDPGPVDVLKVAHHGSEDPGLGELLDRVQPKLAVISVGAVNPYGHPTASTLGTLARHGVPTLRTDRDGDVSIEVDGGGMRVDG